MFAERLQEVLNKLNATDKDIAEFAGFDRTNISHLRSGRRTAKPSGTTTEKLLTGICLFAKDKGVSDQLCILIGAEPDTDQEGLKSALSSWLFEGTEFVSKPAGGKEKKRRPKFHSFGERLETAMDLAEMHQAIVSWLPLYMSGMIESWSSKKVRDRRFSHTIFLSPGRECIEAFHAAGNESKGIYHYYTDVKSLETCQDAFSLLLNNSTRLISPVLSSNISMDGEAYLIQSSLSVATMPETLVREIDDPVLTEKWRVAHQNLIEHLNNGIMNECIPLANDEDLFAGRISIEPVDGTDVRYYMPEQYALHIQGILDLLENYENYHFVPLPGAPFPHMKLQLTNTESQITHIIPPQVTFSFKHHLMCSAFCDYARSLIEQNAINREVLNARLQTLL